MASRRKHKEWQPDAATPRDGNSGSGWLPATNVHFLERSHHETHDVMVCIGTGKMVHDETYGCVMRRSFIFQS